MARGPQPAHKIILSHDEINKLKHTVRLRKAPYAEVVRAKILLEAWQHPEWRNTGIARKVGCSVETVQKWRQRWSKNSERTVAETPRAGAPRFFSLQPTRPNHGFGLYVAPRKRQTAFPVV